LTRSAALAQAFAEGAGCDKSRGYDPGFLTEAGAARNLVDLTFRADDDNRTA
jgi:hypothetical protein